MPYVILGQPPPDLCPTSNAKTRERPQAMMTPLEAAQQKHQVSILSGHVLGVSHRLAVLTEVPTVEAVRDAVEQCRDLSVVGPGRSHPAGQRTGAHELVSKGARVALAGCQRLGPFGGTRV